MAYDKIRVPADGTKITVNPDFSLNVPARPIIPFIEGDGTGVDITLVMRRVVDAAVAKANKVSTTLPGWRCMPARRPKRGLWRAPLAAGGDHAGGEGLRGIT